MFTRFAARAVSSTRVVANKAPATTLVTRRQMSTDSGRLYNTFFKSNPRYVTFVLVGAAVGEVAYGLVADGIWELNNRGKLYHNVDWSKFESLYVEEEDEDEDDE